MTSNGIRQFARGFQIRFIRPMLDFVVQEINKHREQQQINEHEQNQRAEHRLGFPIVKLECDFVAPSKIGEIITLGLRLEKLGRSSMAIAVDCRYRNEERLRARFVLVAMDLERQRAQPIPDDLRELMQAFEQGQFDINNLRRDS